MATVPSSEQWTRDPWAATREDGKIHGLGSNDTKGGGAAMIAAFFRLAATRDFAGRLVFAATCDEETGGEGLEAGAVPLALPRAPPEKIAGDEIVAVAEQIGRDDHLLAGDPLDRVPSRVDLGANPRDDHSQPSFVVTHAARV